MKINELKDGMVISVKSDSCSRIVCECGESYINTDDFKIYPICTLFTPGTNSNPVDDVKSISYMGESLWQRKEYMTFDEARKIGKKIKYKDWNEYEYLGGVLSKLSDTCNGYINHTLSDNGWEIEE